MNADGAKSDYRQFFGLDQDAPAAAEQQANEYEQDRVLAKTGKSPNVFLQNLLQGSVTNI